MRSRTAPTRSSWPPRARYRALLAGPGDDAEADAIEELVAAGGVTADLWRRDETERRHGARAFVSVAPVLGLGGRCGGMGAVAAAARHGDAGAPARCTISPELLAAVDALPPADDEPDVDVAAEASKQRDLPAAPLPPPVPQASCSIGFGLIVARHDRSSSRARSWCSSGLQRAACCRARRRCCSPRRRSSSSPSLADWVAHVDLHALHGPHRGAAALRVAHPDLLPPPAARARLLRPRDGGPDHDPHDHRRRGVLASCCRPGIIQALVSILSFVGVLVVLGILSAGSSRSACSWLVPPLIIATVWFRRVSSRAYTRARDAISTVNAEFQENISGVRVAQAYVREEREHRLVPQHHRRVPERPGHAPSDPVALLPVHPVPVHVRATRSCSGSAASLVHDGVITSRHRDHVPPVPRPVLRADPAALAGVRPVADRRWRR